MIFAEMNANDFFQGGYGDETLLIELVTLVGLEGLLARCGGLDGQLDQVTIFGSRSMQSIINAGWQKLRGQRSPKSLNSEEIFCPNICFFVKICDAF